MQSNQSEEDRLFGLRFLLIFTASFSLFLLWLAPATREVPYLVYFSGGVILVYYLMVSEKKQVPFPYSAKLRTREYLIWSTVPFAVVLAMRFALATLLNLSIASIHPLNLQILIFRGCLPAIIEESFKVVVTNFFAYVLVKKRVFGQKHSVWVGGIGVVAVWTLGHIPYMHYGLFELVNIFLGGMIFFYVTYRMRNFFPAIYMHVLWNTFFY